MIQLAITPYLRVFEDSQEDGATHPSWFKVSHGSCHHIHATNDLTFIIYFSPL